MIKETTRTEIDLILKQIATLESNLGLDSTKNERLSAKAQQKGLLNQIKEIDKDFYKLLVP